MATDRDIKLSRLFFGKDDAESDFAAGGLLRRGFLETAAYEAALTGRKMLVIGRKGSGKSAICVMLHSAPDLPKKTYVVTPDKISADELLRFELPGIPSPLAKELVWRYVLAVQVAKSIVSHASEEHQNGGTPSSVAALRKFLLDNQEGLEDPRLHEKFWIIIKRLKSSISLDAFGVKVAVDAQYPSEGIRASSELDVLEKKVVQAMKDLRCEEGHKSILILVDKLEDVWSNDRNSDAMVVGLLDAAKHISSVFSAVNCVVFLRTDIYDFLQSAEQDKFHSDEIHINWTAERLVKLASLRACASLGLEGSDTEVWHSLFPSRFSGKPIDEYLTSLTLMRPRDMIQLCNVCRDTAVKNGHDAVWDSDIKEASVQFSNWKQADLVREYVVNYPFLLDLFVLFQNSGYLVTRRVLEGRVASLREALASRYPGSAEILTVSGILDILYAVGFLGVRRNGNVSYVYDDANQIEPYENEFLIHPCFRSALRSTSAMDLRTYEPVVARERVSSRRVERGKAPPVRGSRAYYFIREMATWGERIRLLVTRSDFPKEVGDEIKQNLELYENDIHVMLGGENINASNVVSLMNQSRDFFVGLAGRLEESDLVSGRHERELVNTLFDAARSIEEIGSSLLYA
ncbi:P-loop ATPase, Sll1717 family [Streptomyces longisporus]|uniref:Orc1-like AAA ATPase domain-containing protein n=1 Tax=Streptomyces longisporus TaxID=1948 RepID=A0ABN3NJD6_STRLO